MSKVYLAKNIEKIIDSIDFSKLGEKIAIKVHFGEKGCDTYINPETVRKIYEKIKSLGKKPALIECNVLYKGSRVNSIGHIKTAKEHGFTGMNIDILDGEDGSEFVEINSCKIGKGIEKYDSLIVLSHFKGHMMAGFGGTLKNIGMGLGSRAGKLDMHSGIKPKISEEYCISCGKCIENCNAEAIKMVENKAVIDEKKCEGCALCIAVCPNRAVRIPWHGRTNEELQRKIAEYAAAVLSRFPETVFINVLEKITKECDCMGEKQEPMMNDIGILYSNDIVAVDKASLDLVNKGSLGKFSQINSINKENQIKEAQELGLGSSDYDLICLQSFQLV